MQCDNRQIPVPFEYVYFDINLNQPDYFNLTAIGNSIMVKGGVKGIIIYRNGIDEFFAYDRACTHHPTDTCHGVMGNGSNEAICPCCDSHFILNVEGIPTSGSKASYPLKKYTTQFNVNTNILTVSN